MCFLCIHVYAVYIIYQPNWTHAELDPQTTGMNQHHLRDVLPQPRARFRILAEQSHACLQILALLMDG